MECGNDLFNRPLANAAIRPERTNLQVAECFNDGSRFGSGQRAPIRPIGHTRDDRKCGHVSDPEDSGSQFTRVAKCLTQKKIDASLRQRRRLFTKCGTQLLRGRKAGLLPAGTNRAGYENIARYGASEPRGCSVEVAGMV